MMHPNNKARWVAALRSGKYTQTTRVVTAEILNGTRRYAACGVAIAELIYGMAWIKRCGDMSEEPRRITLEPADGYPAALFRLKINYRAFWRISRAESKGWRFLQIADYIECNKTI
jgi:hypothetical protein